MFTKFSARNLGDMEGINSGGANARSLSIGIKIVSLVIPNFPSVSIRGLEIHNDSHHDVSYLHQTVQKPLYRYGTSKANGSPYKRPDSREQDFSHLTQVSSSLSFELVRVREHAIHRIRKELDADFELGGGLLGDSIFVFGVRLRALEEGVYELSNLVSRQKHFRRGL